MKPNVVTNSMPPPSTLINVIIVYHSTTFVQSI